jgi:SAM-dependent methyltransferase
MPLPALVELLDPRTDGPNLEPIGNSVRISAHELRGRSHELPPRHGPVRIADVGEESRKAVQALAEMGREAELMSDWSYGDTGPGRLWSPNAFLLEVADSRKPGQALDLACGVGRDAVALAGSGWQVTAVDRLDDALALGRDLAHRYLDPEEAARIVWFEADLEEGSFQIPAGMDLISMAWYLNRSLIKQAAAALAPGGSLVIETFTSHHRDVKGKPRREELVLQPGELRDLPLKIAFYEAGWHDGRHSLRAWFTKGDSLALA